MFESDLSPSFRITSTLEIKLNLTFLSPEHFGKYILGRTVIWSLFLVQEKGEKWRGDERKGLAYSVNNLSKRKVSFQRWQDQRREILTGRSG